MVKVIAQSLRWGILVIFSFCFSTIKAQTITPDVPNHIDTSKVYLFYLHGGIVQEQGLPAISPVFGPYHYTDIIRTFQHQGYYIISEVRPENTEVSAYAKKTSKQIKRLLKAGVPPNKIVIVGASFGAYIALETAYLLKKPDLRYTLIGFCSDYSLKYYLKMRKSLCGRFLSIYEQTDKTGSCQALLSISTCKTSFNEVVLNMGNSHGFLYQPHPEWVFPLFKWIEEN